MAIRALSHATFLLAAMSGCGGGGPNTASGSSVPKAIAGIEDETAGTPGSKDTVKVVKHAPRVDPSLIPEPGAPLVRETYAYAGGNRDPFASVLESATIGPELADLELVAIMYQQRSPSASVAVLRDRITAKRYTLREGERAGRSRVADIGQDTVTFTIDDYGTQRQVTLSLRKREDIKP